MARLHGVEIHFAREGTLLAAASGPGEDVLRDLVRRQVCCIHERVASIKTIHAQDGLRVMLDQRGVCTVGDLLEERTCLPIAYSAFISLVEQLCVGLEALHAGGGGAMGQWSWDNILLGVHGDVWVLSCPPLGPALVGPEGLSRASTATDVAVLWSMLEQLMEQVDLPAQLHALLASAEKAVAYGETMSTLQRGATAAVEERFRSPVELLDAYREVWSLLEVSGDKAALGHLGQRMLFRARPRALQRAADGSWIRTSEGELLDLTERPMLRRLIGALVDAEGRPTTADALIAATWPGERILRSAARNRLYAALSRLRAMGLRDAIANDRRGYYLTLDVVESEASPTIALPTLARP